MHVEQDIVPDSGLRHPLTDAHGLLSPALVANLSLPHVLEAQIQLPLGHDYSTPKEMKKRKETIQVPAAA